MAVKCSFLNSMQKLLHRLNNTLANSQSIKTIHHCHTQRPLNFRIKKYVDYAIIVNSSSWQPKWGTLSAQRPHSLGLTVSVQRVVNHYEFLTQICKVAIDMMLDIAERHSVRRCKRVPVFRAEFSRRPPEVSLVALCRCGDTRKSRATDLWRDQGLAFPIA